MSFWSNGVDWVRSLRKIQLQDFLFQKSLKRPPGRVCTLFRRKPKLRKRNKHEFWVKWGGLGAFVAENSTASFLFQKSLKRTPGEFRTSSSVENRNSENATNMSFGSNGWIGCVRCGKFNCKFFCSKSRYNGPPERVSHIVPSKTETPKTQQHEFWVKRGGLGAFVAENSTASFLFQKSLKRTSRRVSHHCSVENETRKATNMSFGSNGVDWVRSLRKIQLQDFLFQSRYNGPPGRVSHRCSVENRNSEKATNMSFGSNRVDWCVRCGKFNCKFFVPKVDENGPPGEFGTMFRRKRNSKTQQT
jgi:hypothetical protein